MAKQGESSLSLLIRRALNARGHKVWKNHGNRFVERGIADLSGVSVEGRGIVLETKMPGKEISGLSPDQYRFLKACAGVSPLAIVSVVSSVQDAIRYVEDRRYANHVTPDCVLMVPLAELSEAEWVRYSAAVGIDLDGGVSGA